MGPYSLPSVYYSDELQILKQDEGSEQTEQLLFGIKLSVHSIVHTGVVVEATLDVFV